jgi:hypothetical protein
MLERLQRRQGPDPHGDRVLMVSKPIPYKQWHTWTATQVRPCACGDGACPGPPLILLPQKLTSEEGEYQKDAHHGA